MSDDGYAIELTEEDEGLSSVTNQPVMPCET